MLVFSVWSYLASKWCADNLTFPRRVMDCVDICSTVDRLRLSDNQVTALVSATLKADGVEPGQLLSSQPQQQDGAGCWQGTTSARSAWQHLTRTLPSMLHSTGMKRCWEMSWEVILDHVRDSGCACLRTTCISCRQATGSTSDRQLNRNGSGRGIHGFAGGMGVTGVRMRWRCG